MSKDDSGGLNALIDVNTSVTGIRNVIENLTIKNSGKFWDYNGEFIHGKLIFICSNIVNHSYPIHTSIVRHII